MWTPTPSAPGAAQCRKCLHINAEIERVERGSLACSLQKGQMKRGGARLGRYGGSFQTSSRDFERK